MRTINLLIFILVAASIVGAGCIDERAKVGGGGNSTPDFTGVDILTGEVPQEALRDLDRAPDFAGVDVLTGEGVNLKQYQGDIVLLNFVNYGCSASLNERVSKQLIMIRDLKDERRDFIPLSVFCGCCPEDVLRNFATEADFEWPWILDVESSIVPLYAEHIQKYGYPTLVIIDRDQNIGYVGGYTEVSVISDKIDELKEMS